MVCAFTGAVDRKPTAPASSNATGRATKLEKKIVCIARRYRFCFALQGLEEIKTCCRIKLRGEQKKTPLPGSGVRGDVLAVGSGLLVYPLLY